MGLPTASRRSCPGDQRSQPPEPVLEVCSRQARRRCLVAVSEFCEWSGEEGSKKEHCFSVPSQRIFAFAGIWRPIASERVYAFLTCEADPLVGAVHQKAMPVIPSPR